MNWSEYLEVMTILVQLVMIFLIIPSCLIVGFVLISRLLKIAWEEIS